MHVAIDFETANSQRSSACSLGVAVVDSGKLVERRSWLIRPQELYFEPFNTYIHGISEEDVRDELEFDGIWDEIRPYLMNNLVLAHNASFDFSVLRHVLDDYGLEYPAFDYLCTVAISRKVWPHLERHKLNFVAEHLDIELDHHDAEEDAVASALIGAYACQEQGVAHVRELAKKLGLKIGRLYPGGYESSSAGRKSQKRLYASK
jgi:DNA polymerase-3 subunit epsilon